jgi:dihydroorotate dehydrogenase electron transfer subunit
MKLSVYRIAANQHRTTRILDVKTENPTVKTFTFKDKHCATAEPGQFLMLWIPGVDETPLSILDARKNCEIMVAVKKVGEATEALHSRKVGEVIGIRGPFGNSFTIKNGKALMVGGGTGIAPLLFLAKKLKSKTAKLVFVTGAKTKEELMFIDELDELCGKGNVIATTEDGSFGVKGLATTPLETLLVKERFDIVYACGPERMMLKIFDLTEKHRIALEVSLERLMRCAIGLCGSCVVGKYRVCRDGPVFTASQLKEAKNEFGVSKRDFSGKRIPLE